MDRSQSFRKLIFNSQSEQMIRQLESSWTTSQAKEDIKIFIKNKEQQLQSIIEKYNNLFDSYNNLNQEQQQFQQKKQQLEQQQEQYEQQQLEQQNQKDTLLQTIEQLQQKIEISKSSEYKQKIYSEIIDECFKAESEEQYDIKINFNSLFDLQDGLIIENRIEGLKKIQENNRSKQIGILGHQMSGKTFLLAKLTNRVLNKGFNQRTKGLNIISTEIQENHVYFYDTGNSGEPLFLFKELQKLQYNLLNQENSFKTMNFESYKEEYEEQLQQQKQKHILRKQKQENLLQPEQENDVIHKPKTVTQKILQKVKKTVIIKQLKLIKTIKRIKAAKQSIQIQQQQQDQQSEQQQQEPVVLQINQIQTESQKQQQNIEKIGQENISTQELKQQQNQEEEKIQEKQQNNTLQSSQQEQEQLDEQKKIQQQQNQETNLQENQEKKQQENQETIQQENEEHQVKEENQEVQKQQQQQPEQEMNLQQQLSDKNEEVTKVQEDEGEEIDIEVEEEIEEEIEKEIEEDVEVEVEVEEQKQENPQPDQPIEQEKQFDKEVEESKEEQNEKIIEEIDEKELQQRYDEQFSKFKEKVIELRELIKQKEVYLTIHQQAIYQEVINYEKIVQNFLFQNCNMIIMMVGNQSREDQQMINFICGQLKSSPQKEIIIIHNFFQNVQKKTDIDIMCKNYIINCYNVEEGTAPIRTNQLCSVYKDYSYNKNNPIIHLVLGLQGTEAGNYYNEGTLHYLLQRIGTIQTQAANINILDNLKNYLNQNLSKYIRFPMDHVSKDVLIRDIVYDHFGTIKQNEEIIYTPNFDIWEDQEEVLINIDLPGVEDKNNIKIQFPINSFTNTQYLKLKVQRKTYLPQDKQNLKVKDQKDKYIVYGDLALSMPIYTPASDLRLDKDGKKVSFKNNVLQLRLFKQKIIDQTQTFTWTE